jgi:hypothetical protein
VLPLSGVLFQYEDAMQTRFRRTGFWRLLFSFRSIILMTLSSTPKSAPIQESS